jgi:hypothetical protein
MQTRSRGDYTIAGRELVAEGTDLRVQVLTLAAGQCVPWHYHTEISDSFVCLEGPMVVETRAPRHVYRLMPGEWCVAALLLLYGAQRSKSSAPRVSPEWATGHLKKESAQPSSTADGENTFTGA